MFNARVAPQHGAVALHIFGTRQGTCPPGAALAGDARDAGSDGGAAGSSSAAVQEGDVAAGGPFGLAFNGSVIDLSSTFQPE